MPDAIALQDAPTEQPRTWLEANVTLITRIAIQAARRHRLPPQDRQELLSIFWTHLAKDDCRVLRQFRGSSGIATYLRTVIDRVVLDMRTSSWGKWRPSARARRLGAPAEAFERLVIRDGRAPEEAHTLLRAMMGPAVPADLVDSLAGQRPAQRRLVSLDRASAHRATPRTRSRRCSTSAASGTGECWASTCARPWARCRPTIGCSSGCGTSWA